ncbi:MAG: hypothetical protein MUF58_11830 [Arcicella sp.]|jgi:hypothetical protein|nr:hypothetical protein [Arcicella sp.]
MATGTQKLIANIGYVIDGTAKMYVWAMQDVDSGEFYPTVLWEKEGATTLNPPKLHTIGIDVFKDFVRNKNGAVSELLDFTMLVDGDQFADDKQYVVASNVTDISSTKWKFPASTTAAAKHFTIKGDGITDEMVSPLQLADEDGDGLPDDGGEKKTDSLFGIDFSGKLDFLKTKSPTGIGKTWDDVVSFVEKNPVIVGAGVYFAWKPIIQPLWKKIKKALKF